MITKEEFYEDALRAWQSADPGSKFWNWHSKKTVEFDLFERAGFKTRAGQAKPVEIHGGENMGSLYFIIFQVDETDQYFRVEGVYSSWDSMDWFNPIITEVIPEVVTRVEYVKVQR